MSTLYFIYNCNILKVNREFLDFIMLKMVLGAKGREWIRFCIPAVRYLVLMNGKHVVSLVVQKEWDRKTHYHLCCSLTLVIKVLIRMMDVVVRSYVMGFSAAIGEQGILRVSRLLFVDDTLVFLWCWKGLVGVLEISMMIRLDTWMAYWRNKMLQWCVEGTWILIS